MLDTPQTIRSRYAPSMTSDRYETLVQMSDEDLMEQFQQGTVEAFNILVDKYSERLTHYLYGFLGDSKRCEDCYKKRSFAYIEIVILISELQNFQPGYTRLLETWLVPNIGNANAVVCIRYSR